MSENISKDDYLLIIHSYMNTFLQKVILKYKSISDEPKLFNEDEKIPVWIFWAQGESDMPEMVRLCISSVKRNFPSDRAEIRLITMENYCDFVSLDEIVIDRLSSGVISFVHFSDVLRTKLLLEYGGWWIDSTIFVGKKISSDIFYPGLFYTQKYGFLTDAPYADPAKGRWATYLLFAAKNTKLFQFLYESWIFYLERHDRLWDYYLMDYMIGIAYESFSDVKEMIDNVPKNNLHTGDLYAFYSNQEYDPSWLEELINDTQFFKMTYKQLPNRLTPDGKETNYGHLLKEYLGEDRST